MADENTATPANTSEEDGKNTAAETGNAANNGTSADANEGVAKTFTQADVDRIVKERLEKARKSAEQKAADERAEIERKAALEQGNFKTLYEDEIKKREAVEADRTRLERERLIDRVAAEFQLPEALRNRLQGDTEEALRADAQSLAELVKPEQVEANGTRVVPQRSGAAVVPVNPTKKMLQDKYPKPEPRKR